MLSCVFVLLSQAPAPASLDRMHSSILILAAFVLLGLVAAALFQVGLVGLALRLFGALVRGSIRQGFLVWKALFSWASWRVYLGLIVGLLVLGWLSSWLVPTLTTLCGLAALFMGVTACLAYMFIDLERYEVERGYKAIHNPLKGQELAVHLMEYGPRVGIPLLGAAAIGFIGGFAQFNQGLYETIGRGWYSVGTEKSAPGYVDFLAYALLNIYRIVDLVDLANSYNFLRVTYVHQAHWQAATLLALFKTFFTLVLLQQIFASLRQGTLLAETITDFWSPHPPIHERARNSLPQHGVNVVRPLLASLRSVPSLTREQRDQLPLVIAAIGPASIPILTDHLDDPHEHIRVVAATALGHLHALDALPVLVELRHDPSEMVRQSLVTALGIIGGPGVQAVRRRSRFHRLAGSSGRWLERMFRRRRRTIQPARVTNPPDRVELVVSTLRATLSDSSTMVRLQAVTALGMIGPAAGAAIPDLMALLADSDETVRCCAAEALGKMGEKGPSAVPALAELLEDPSPAVKEAAADALGSLKDNAADAVPALVPLLQDREEEVRQAAAEAIGRIGTLPEQAADSLVEGLSSPDNVVRAQTADALGAIGATAEAAAPALVEALEDSNDQVRARAAEALGKIGEGAADVAVAGLVRALRDSDNWVSALAAEALGEMGEAADAAVPALVRSLRHVNPQVRANAAEALGRMGDSASGAVSALLEAVRDEDGGVRCQAVRALGEVGGSASEELDRVAGAVRAALPDSDPQVRAAAVEAVGRLGRQDEATLAALLPLLEDANDQVKFQATRVLPRLAGPAPAVLDGLCRRLLEDDSVWIQASAATALGQLGSAAVSAGAALLRAVQTGEATVREQALRAVVMIQPPEAADVFAAGLRDASGEIRKMASGGWMKAAAIPETAIPGLIEALRDPEVQVRANAAHALARLESLPAEAIPLLIECTADPRDGLRMNAAMALESAPAESVREVMEHLLEDPNPRVRLIAADCLLSADAGHARAAAAVAAALADPAPRVRKAALGLVESFGAAGAVFLDNLTRRDSVEDEPEVRDLLGRLVERLHGWLPVSSHPSG
jgi:HEAT repeat protein